jgi:23S rRNA (pseudouridine1915-N3)-methyltransferase
VKLKLVAVGRDKNEPICQAAAVYLERLAHHFPSELIEVKEEPARASVPVARVRLAEAERIRKVLGPDDLMIALDERGKELSSIDLANRLARWAQEGRQSIAFVVGGPNGLDPEFVRQASERWSLSKFTLPHRIARLIIAEQLYRASTILRGEPYHR